MIHNKMGRSFQRGQGGDSLVYKHEKFFILGNFQTGYHPILNIRLDHSTHRRAGSNNVFCLGWDRVTA